jgi:hypothetical protein
MFKKVLTFGLLACALTFVACSDEKEEEPAAITEAAKPATTPEPEITYSQGFYDMERDGANTWRWMSDRGVIKLINTGKDMKLRIVGEVPLVELKNTPKYTITFNGEVLEEMSAKAVDKEYVIPVAKQGNAASSELVISSNLFFIPSRVHPKSTDERKLAFSLRQLIWQPQ